MCHSEYDVTILIRIIVYHFQFSKCILVENSCLAYVEQTQKVMDISLLFNHFVPLI